MPAARGQHLFTRTKRFLMDWAQRAGAGGHVQRGDRRPPLQPARQHRARRARDRLPARLDPGLGLQRRRRTARRGRQSAALFYTKLNDGHERAGLRARAPPRDRRPDPRALRAARRRSPSRRPTAELPERTELHVEVDDDHNLALITVHVPGADLEAVDRRRAPPPLPPRRPRRDLPRPAAGARRRPPSSPTTSSALGVSYAGVFPNHRTDGDVLRMQSLHRVRVKADDVAVASDHGRELLDYVLADLPR